MARQARSEVTRRRILTAAVELFSENGYSATGLGDIIERAELTKGALYYHFDSKESLATAIIEEAGADLLNTFRGISASTSPALENIIHGIFVATDYVRTDKVIRIGTQLLRTLGGFNEAARRAYHGWLDELTVRVRQAKAEGDLRADLDPDVTAEVILATMLGADLLANAISGGADSRRRVTDSWHLLLPAIVSDESLSYFREFLGREALRPSPFSAP